ncbi:MAG: acyltransferase family protein [Alistipes sp.]|nr:acyltransferase family protein [Alistipes sp.]
MRVTWIDIVRGICIYCVVLSHTLNVPDLYRCIFDPFFLTGFFFLSGIVFKSTSIKQSLFNSITKILWPYIINSIVIMFARLQWIELLLANDKMGVLIFFQNWGCKIINGTVFWFLACLFIVQIFAGIITKIIKGNKICLYCITALCLSSIFIISGKPIAPWSINTAIFALGYFLMGILYRNKLLSINLNDKKRLVGLFPFASYILVIILMYCINPNHILFDLHTHRLSPELLFLCLSLVSIPTLCLLAMSIKRCKLLEIIGENSLSIYMYHSYGALLTNTIFSYAYINTLALYPYLYTILVSCTSTLITLGIAIIINKYFPILIGRGNKINSLRTKFNI